MAPLSVHKRLDGISTSELEKLLFIRLTNVWLAKTPPAAIKEDTEKFENIFFKLRKTTSKRRA